MKAEEDQQRAEEKRKAEEAKLNKEVNRFEFAFSLVADDYNEEKDEERNEECQKAEAVVDVGSKATYEKGEEKQAETITNGADVKEKGYEQHGIPRGTDLLKPQETDEEKKKKEERLRKAKLLAQVLKQTANGKTDAPVSVPATLLAVHNSLLYFSLSLSLSLRHFDRKSKCHISGLLSLATELLGKHFEREL